MSQGARWDPASYTAGELGANWACPEDGARALQGPTGKNLKGQVLSSQRPRQPDSARLQAPGSSETPAGLGRWRALSHRGRGLWDLIFIPGGLYQAFLSYLLTDRPPTHVHTPTRTEIDGDTPI